MLLLLSIGITDAKKPSLAPLSCWGTLIGFHVRIQPRHPIAHRIVAYATCQARSDFHF